jgi:hypothetical protein
MILTLDGIWFRINEINRLENAHTTVSANDITNAVSSLVVMASAEQMPSTCKAIGLLSIIGPKRAFFISLVSAMSVP